MAQQPSTLLASALDLYANAREAEQYEIAYHALCAALHAAENLQDLDALQFVRQSAGECRSSIDANKSHKLSTHSAQARGHESIFRQLAVMAEAAGLRIHADAHKRQGRPRAPLAETKD